jgi:preprotein translocase subunit YajC
VVEQGGKVKRTFAIILMGLATVLTASGCVPVESTTTATNGGTGSSFLGYLPMIIILVLLVGMFYFLMIRPMRQREKRHDEMVQQLSVGDRVITAGGVYGDIVSLTQDSVVVKIESGATMRVTKGSILNVQSRESIQ